MSERYTKLFSLPKNLYAEGSPVIIEAGVLTLDNNTNRVFVQLKFRNISDKEIKALSVTLKAYYVTGKEASEPVKYQYLDFCSNIDEEFGAKTPILLQDNTVRSFSVHIDEVVYYDNTVGEVNLDYSESVPEQHLLCKTDGWNNDTASEFKKLTNDKCVYAVCEYKDLWLCSCGCANSLVRDKRCRRCGCAHDLLKSITPEKAQAHINDTVYDDAITKMQSNSVTDYDKAIALFNSIHGWKDADDKAKECEKLRDELKQSIIEARQAEEKRRKKRNKKIIKISCIPVACIITVVLLVSVIKSAIVKNKQYTTAIEELNAGNVAAAYSGFAQLGKYKDSKEKAEEVRSGKYLKTMIEKAEVGDTVLLGEFEQDNISSNGKEMIEWTVLAREEKKVLVISSKVLDGIMYSNTNENCYWKTSLVRKWLNEKFFEDAFQPFEQALIKQTDLTDDYYPEYNTDNDKVFLLSEAEVNKYLSLTAGERCICTPYASTQVKNTIRVPVENDDHTTTVQTKCDWWLRSSKEGVAMFVYQGRISLAGVTCIEGVRPAMWVSVE